MLTKRGSPNLVAGAYLPQKYLIGPAWYPLYCWVLTLVILLVQVPLFVTVIGPMNVLNSTAILPALFQTLGEFLDDFPTVTRDAAIAALEIAKALLVSQLG